MICLKCGAITFDGETCHDCHIPPKNHTIYLWDQFHGTRRKGYYVEFPRQKHQPIFNRKRRLDKLSNVSNIRKEIISYIKILMRHCPEPIISPVPFKLYHRNFVIKWEDNGYAVYSQGQFQFKCTL